MKRIMIAAKSEPLTQLIYQRLQDDFLIEISNSGNDALDLFNSFDPNILLLDLRLPEIDGLHILHIIRSAGRNTPVIVITDYSSDYIQAQLESLQVSKVIRIPCDVDELVLTVYSIAAQLDNGEIWNLELEASHLLYSLGFRSGRGGYLSTRDGLCMRFLNFEGSITKEIYPAIVKKRKGNVKQVEKSIRDAIQAARNRGNRKVWEMYFPCIKDDPEHCPGNDEFLSRIAKALLDLSYFNKNSAAR